jgi:hypothetical protein
MKQTSDYPDEIANRFNKTGQPREQVEQRVRQVAQQTTGAQAR